MVDGRSIGEGYFFARMTEDPSVSLKQVDTSVTLLFWMSKKRLG
jgi:hypothetical protein